MIISITAIIALIAMVAENFINYTGDRSSIKCYLQLIGKSIGDFWWPSMYFSG